MNEAKGSYNCSRYQFHPRPQHASCSPDPHSGAYRKHIFHFLLLIKQSIWFQALCIISDSSGLNCHLSEDTRAPVWLNKSGHKWSFIRSRIAVSLCVSSIINLRITPAINPECQSGNTGSNHCGSMLTHVFIYWRLQFWIKMDACVQKKLQAQVRWQQKSKVKFNYHREDLF